MLADRHIDFAIWVAGRYGGVTIEEVEERFGVVGRTAQRMLRWLEGRFPDTEVVDGDDRRRRWRRPLGEVKDLITLSAEEVAALELATKTMERSGLKVEAGYLQGLRQKIMALVPRSRRALIEPDLEPLLEAQGLAARPGPRQRVHPSILAAIAEAIKAGHILEIVYQPRETPGPTLRRVTPYGLLTGLRQYLVARLANEPNRPIRHFIVEGIHSAVVTGTPFTRDPDFDLQAFANRAFGVFQNDQEFGEVVWRFLPAAAAHARGFEFHPNQQVEEQPDGSLIVRFWASGDLEMCWHLYMWGDKVEVLAPKRLRDMVHPWRRADFPGLP